ncbi:unnamed protein product, partial [Owenia fusiformis]
VSSHLLKVTNQNTSAPNSTKPPAVKIQKLLSRKHHLRRPRGHTLTKGVVILQDNGKIPRSVTKSAIVASGRITFKKFDNEAAMKKQIETVMMATMGEVKPFKYVKNINRRIIEEHSGHNDTVKWTARSVTKLAGQGKIYCLLQGSSSEHPVNELEDDVQENDKSTSTCDL